ncbi:MAG: AMP-binding protein, partial [Deltaproteobacteria bacterium]|nr:AMP-binding protein [Deltaproteobacteria bacterium]
MEQNLVSFFESNARQLAEKAAVVWEGGSLPWSELDRRASGFARHLAGQGIKAGDRVAILIP